MSLSIDSSNLCFIIYRILYDYSNLIGLRCINDTSRILEWHDGSLLTGSRFFYIVLVYLKDFSCLTINIIYCHITTTIDKLTAINEHW